MCLSLRAGGRWVALLICVTWMPDPRQDRGTCLSGERSSRSSLNASVACWGLDLCTTACHPECAISTSCQRLDPCPFHCLQHLQQHHAAGPADAAAAGHNDCAGLVGVAAGAATSSRERRSSLRDAAAGHRVGGGARGPNVFSELIYNACSVLCNVLCALEDVTL